jgi:hypothetical protein
MTIQTFWEIVDRVHHASNGDMDSKCELLGDELRKLPADEVRSFDKHFGDCEYQAYTWELWAAAYIIGGGCSDDAFSDFRTTLISMGQETFARVVASPGVLVEWDLDEESAFYEGYQYVAPEIYEELTGEDMPVREIPEPKEPAGARWDEEHVSELYPELARKYEANG